MKDGRLEKRQKDTRWTTYDQKCSLEHLVRSASVTMYIILKLIHNHLPAC